MMMSMRVLVVSAVVWISGLPLTAQAGDAGLEAVALRSIGETDLVGHISFLASDELEGRRMGSNGGKITHRYLASYYARLGLTPFGDDGTYLQSFEARGSTGRNVIALLRGSDPELRDQAILIGAHLDHVGRGRRGDGEIHNGADDNASGTAGVLELAEAFLIYPPRRSIIFMHFDGEERGLLGSRHYCENPTYPLDMTVTMINMDMIGRSTDDYLFVGGIGTSPIFEELITAVNAPIGLKIEFGEGGRAPSDNTSFYAKGMPVLFLFTSLHEDYHRPTDDWDKINYPAAARIVRLAFEITRELADREEPPAFQRSDRTALPADFSTRMRSRIRFSGGGPNRPRLGARPDMQAEGEGFVIASITDGSPAAAAGLEPADRIVEFEGKKIETWRDLFGSLRDVKPGQSVTVKVLRGEETVELTVSFPAPEKTDTRGV